MKAILHPGKGVRSLRLTMPGDKSISQRLSILAGISQGESCLRNLLQGEDSLHTLRAMQALGAEVVEDGGVYRVIGPGRLTPAAGDLDLGNSGTGTRLLTGLLSAQAFDSVLTGDASLRKRPMKRIRDPLAKMGAEIHLQEPGGTAPIRIQGRRLRAIEYVLPVASAQVKSAILLAGLYADGITRVIEPAPCRDHTELLFQGLGLPLQVDGACIELEGFGPDGPGLSGRNWTVPGDFSSAAFWFVWAAVQEGTSVVVTDLGLNPRRTALLEILSEMGAEVRVDRKETGPGEAVGTVQVTGAALKGVEIGGDRIPNLIDEIPALCVAACFAEGETQIRDAAELRVKESDRIQLMSDNLRLAGVEVQDRPDGLEICGGARIREGWTSQTAGDHRMGMSMAILAASAGVSAEILDIECTATSYPDFWNHLEQAGTHVRRTID